MAGGGNSIATASVAPAPRAESVPRPEPVAENVQPALMSFADVVKLFEQKREAPLAAQLKRMVRLVRFAPGVIEFNPAKGAPSDLAGRVGKILTQWTGQRWVVSVANAAGEDTLHDQEIAAAASDPTVRAILEAFPGAEVEAIRKADPQT
jgi:DNA polymerase-3 subunit gamma/tau